MTAVLALRGIGKRYGGFDALADIDLTVEKGSFVSLLGPSGCGKTTLLRIIAGILLPDSGEIQIAGRDVTNDPPFARDLAMVFQDYALFPHMTVVDNVAFGIRMRGTAEDKRRARDRVQEVLDLVRLGSLGKRYPAELSGGQQQRVAIARALAPRPSLLLMDEPLSNLDAKVRDEMRFELKDIQRKAAVTTCYVTHDQEEALTLSDMVVVMSAGRIAQRGTPDEIYAAPQSRFVADFVGKSNLLDGQVTDGGRRFVLGDGLVLELGQATASGRVSLVSIRPEQVVVSGAPAAGANSFRGTIDRLTFAGATTQVLCTIGTTQLSALLANRADSEPLSEGQAVSVTIPPRAVRPIPDYADARA